MTYVMKRRRNIGRSIFELESMTKILELICFREFYLPFSRCDHTTGLTVVLYSFSFKKSLLWSSIETFSAFS